ncbi:MAG: NAD(P)/FAD-dependent oxidoreductase [Alphaproteobacteria bacterium]|nr:NAD(P)/FAD-dependent oxidoreductase [Alphaproteobacteria bacterium]
MSEVVVLGAGLGGTLMAYELRAQLRPEDRLTVIGQGHVYHFVPSNPWVAVGWRERKDVDVDLADVMKRKNIRYLPQGAKRVNPKENTITLEDGETVPYDYLVIATGPDLAFDEIEGFGPNAHTHSICHIDDAEKSFAAFKRFVEKPGPIVIGAVQGASCFGPAYEFAFILDTELRRHKIRDRVPMTFVTSEPYIGHLGLDGVGDTKGLLESELRSRHIKWVTNAKVKKFEEGKLTVDEIGDGGAVLKTHEIASAYTMMLPPFRGVPALMGLEGLVNPRGFVLIDKYQRNPTFQNAFGIGVCVAIPPVGPSPVPVGVPKTGFMIESMVTATARNIGELLRGRPVHTVATWNAICLADFGDKGVAFVAQPQIPPRNVNWASEGRWVHWAKLLFEKFFIHKIRRGACEPFYERWVLQLLGIRKLKTVKGDTP